MRFRVTTHAGHGAPSDAIDQLWGRWSVGGMQARATRRGTAILVDYGDYDGDKTSRENHVEAERLEVLDLVLGICERHPELSLAWYAVAPVD